MLVPWITFGLNSQVDGPWLNNLVVSEKCHQRCLGKSRHLCLDVSRDDNQILKGGKLLLPLFSSSPVGIHNGFFSSVRLS